FPARTREASSPKNRKCLNLSSLEKRYGALQHERFEVRRLPMLEERLLADVLFVQQKVIRLVARTVDDEQQVSRLPTHCPGQLAQALFDLVDFALSGTPAGNDYVCHCFPVDDWEAPKASGNRFAASPRSRDLFCNAWIDRRHMGPEMPIAPTTWPLKSYTGIAAQRTSLLNSPSSKAMPARRTS